MFNDSPAVTEEIKEFFKFSSNDFEHYPCTPLQSALYSATIEDPASFVYQMTWKLTESVTSEALRNAWRHVIAKNEILRSVFVSTSDGVYQVALTVAEHNIPTFTSYEDLETTLKLGLKRGFTEKSTSWVEMTTVLDPDGQEMYFIFKLHHLLFDGWSLAILMSDLNKAFDDALETTVVSFKPFVEYCLAIPQNEIQSFWSTYLSDLAVKPAFMKKLNESGSQRIEKTGFYDRNVLTEAAKSFGITEASLIKLAWALTLKLIYQSNDVIFGEVVSGRDVNVENIRK
jgi:hypothetical protein